MLFIVINWNGSWVIPFNQLVNRIFYASTVVERIVIVVLKDFLVLVPAHPPFYAQEKKPLDLRSLVAQ